MKGHQKIRERKEIGRTVDDEAAARGTRGKVTMHPNAFHLREVRLVVSK